MKALRILLSEKGDISALRAMSIYSLIVGSFIGIYGLIDNKDLTGVAALSGVFVGVAFAGKVSQKIVEGK